MLHFLTFVIRLLARLLNISYILLGVLKKPMCHPSVIIELEIETITINPRVLTLLDIHNLYFNSPCIFLLIFMTAFTYLTLDI